MDRTTVVVVASAVPLVLLASVQGARGAVLHGLLLGLLGCAAAAALLLLRRRAPGPGVAVTGACSMAAVALQPLPPVALLPFAVGVVIAMAADARVWAVSAVAAAYLVPLVTLFTSGSALDAARGFGTMVILVAALGGGAFARGRVVRRRQEERAQADRQRRAVEDERLRIARELHDVLAHSLSSITVQAGVGLHLAGGRPAAAVEALETIRTASRAALDEVRGLLGLLREDGPAPLDPGRGLAALPQLVEEVRGSGAHVDLADRIDPPPSVPVHLTLYCVVQESLTNARRHAPGAAISPFPFFLLVPLFWLVVIVVVALLVRRGARRRWEAAGGPPFGPNRSPEQMLSARFANGEIDEVEYRSRLEVPRANRPPRR